MHIGPNDTSKYTPNEEVNKVFDLKNFVTNNAKRSKVIILANALGESKVRTIFYKVSNNLKEFNKHVAKVCNIIRKLLKKWSLHLDEYGELRLAMILHCHNKESMKKD